MYLRVFFLCLVALSCAFAQAPDLAFYYGTRPPVAQLRHFDQIVVQPNQLHDEEVSALLRSGSSIVAYVSVGEVAQNSVDFVAIDKRWVIGKNPAWDSLVMDYRAEGWRRYLLEKHFRPLWQLGYRAFFLDTMDSYLLVQKQGPERQAQEDGLRDLLRTIKSEFAGSKVIVNRGFDVLDTAHDYIDGLIAEAYFSIWDPQTREITAVTDSNRQWLHNQLLSVQNNYHIPVTVVDYVQPGEWDKARDYAEKIIAGGFTPWIANGDLNMLGQGRKRVLPRRVLALYDGPLDGQWDHPLFRYVAAQFERLGIAFDYVNIEYDSLPLETLAGRYAGVVTWLSPRSHGTQASLCVRLQNEAQAGVRSLFLGQLPNGDSCARWLAQLQNKRLPSSNLQIEKEQPSLAQAEGERLLRSRELPDSFSKNANQSWLRLRDDSGAIFDPIVVGDFGGFALQPYVIDIAADENAQWLIEPLAFFKAALHLNAQPQFDLAHENGERVALASLSSDGLMATTPVGDAVTAAWHRVLSRFHLPVSVAVAEAELDGNVLSEADKQARLTAVQTVLQLPTTELVSHSYSHPFFWRTFDGHRDYSSLSYFYTLPQTNYLADLKREIVTPSETLMRLLNRPVTALFWPGDAVPGAAATALAEQNQIGHFGGGGVRVFDQKISQANRLPLLRPSKWGLQVLSPLQDENAYARSFNQKALTYRNVIANNHTLAPDRPWSLTFNLDALARPDAETVVADVLRETAAQNLIGLFWSEYLQRARSWQDASIAENLNGDYDVFGDAARALKFHTGKSVDLNRSIGVAGFRHQTNELQIHLTREHSTLHLATGEAPWHLHSADVPVLQWQRDADGVKLKLRVVSRGNVRIAAAERCTAKTAQDTLIATAKNSLVTLTFSASQAAQEIALVCQ